MSVGPEVFAEYGSIGVFLAFMIYQYLAQKKEIQELIARFFAQLETLEQKYEDRETNLRNRYDLVIKDYKADLEQARQERSSLREELSEQMSFSLAELKNANQILTEWQQEKKLKHLAKRLDKEQS
jgi:glycine cleavage system pyridoxal-binding protein P